MGRLTVVEGQAAEASMTRRLDVQASRAVIVASILVRAGGQPLWLVLDETLQGRTEAGSRLGLLALRPVYRAPDPGPVGPLPVGPGPGAAPYPDLLADRRGGGTAAADDPLAGVRPCLPQGRLAAPERRRRLATRRP